jgi:hypothetical protein
MNPFESQSPPPRPNKSWRFFFTKKLTNSSDFLILNNSTLRKCDISDQQIGWHIFYTQPADSEYWISNHPLMYTHSGGHTMKRKLLALALGLFASAIAVPTFASSDPPTATLDSTPAAAAINAKAYTAIETGALNITLKVDAVNYMRDTARPAPTLMPSTISGPPGWSAGITKLDARGGKALVITRSGDEIYGISVGLSPRPGDSSMKSISAAGNVASAGQVLLATAPPANGFAHPDLLAASVNSVIGLGAA